MSARLHQAGPDALDRLLPMVAAFHAEEGIETDDAARRAALAPLLEGSPYGAVYLLGPERAPIGYIVATFSWSVEFGGLDAMLDEIWIRPAVRSRGMGGEAITALLAHLKEAGLVAISLETDREGPTRALYERLGFAARARYATMTRRL